MSTESVRKTPLWIEHVGTALTVGYLILVAVGMFHSVLGYRHFGVNILDYAEASDFLLAPFRDPMVLLVTVVPGVLALGYMSAADRWSRRMTERRREAGKPRAWWESSDAWQARLQSAGPVLRVALALFWVFVSANTYQRLVAYWAMRGEGTNVTVEMANGVSERGTPTRPLVLAGATSRYLFLFRTESWETGVVPTENVQRVVPQGTLPEASVQRRERSWQRLDRPVPMRPPAAP